MEVLEDPMEEMKDPPIMMVKPHMMEKQESNDDNNEQPCCDPAGGLMVQENVKVATDLKDPKDPSKQGFLFLLTYTSSGTSFWQRMMKM